jgi:hypothetical protein
MKIYMFSHHSLEIHLRNLIQFIEITILIFVYPCFLSAKMALFLFICASTKESAIPDNVGDV